MKPALAIVPDQLPQPYDEKKGRKRIEIVPKQLLRASVRYILEGQTGTQKDRLREASDMSGIPRALLEVEAGL